RRVQPRDAADPPGRRPAGIQDDQDPPVALGPPGPDHHVTLARRGPPVDGPDVVTDHVLAERVELGTRATQQRAVLPVELAQLRELLAEVPPAAEWRQYPHGPPGWVRALAGGQPERPGRADKDRSRHLVA